MVLVDIVGSEYLLNKVVFLILLGVGGVGFKLDWLLFGCVVREMRVRGTL